MITATQADCVQQIAEQGERGMEQKTLDPVDVAERKTVAGQAAPLDGNPLTAQNTAKLELRT